jgi:Mn-containing catalase
MLFEEKHYGNLISKQLSDYLREHTSKNDYADVANLTGVSLHTLRYVVARSNNLTQSNSKAVIELAKKAVMNCTNTINDSREAKEYLLEKLQIEGWS